MRSMYWRRPTSISTCGTAPRTAQRFPESYAIKSPLEPHGLERCSRYCHKPKRIQYAGRRSDRPAARVRFGIPRAGRLAADDDVAVGVDRRQLVLGHRPQRHVDRAQHLFEPLADELAGLAHVASDAIAVRPGGLV